jgi:phosphoglycerol transferase
LVEDDSYLGVFGAFGLIVALTLALAGVLGTSRRWITEAGRSFGAIVLIALLLGEVGGLSVLIGVLGFTAVRTWARISVFIGFASLGTLAFVLQHGVEALAGRIRLGVVTIATGLAVAIGVVDLIPSIRTHVPQREVVAEARSDRAFVGAMESALPRGAMVFQLPVLPFPEGGNVNDMVDYDPLKGYISGRGRLRWSYGGMRGRESDWQRQWALEPPRRMIEGLAAAGFSGLYVDRAGYRDEGGSLDASLRPIVGPPAAESGNGRLRWYDLRPVRRALGNRLSQADIRALGAAVTDVPLVEYGPGLYPPEPSGNGATFRWMASAATLVAGAHGRLPNPVRISFVVKGAVGSVLTIRSGSTSSTVNLRPEGSSVELPLVLSGRRTTIGLTTNSPEVEGPGDSRELRAQIVELRTEGALLDQLLPVAR